VKRPLSGNVLRRTAIIHRTVRWCTGLSGEPTIASATFGRAIRGRRVARANSRQGAPDSPVCQLPRSCNGRLRQKRKEIGTGPSTVTVQCATRQKATLAFLDWPPMAPSCLGAIKRPPRRMEDQTKLTRNILRLQDSNFTHSIL
jgi:hypothetical protein